WLGAEKVFLEVTVHLVRAEGLLPAGFVFAVDGGLNFAATGPEFPGELTALRAVGHGDPRVRSRFVKYQSAQAGDQKQNAEPEGSQCAQEASTTHEGPRAGAETKAFAGEGARCGRNDSDVGKSGQARTIRW